MISEFRIYLEGGGNTSLTRTQTRKGFEKFLDPVCQLARQRGIGYKLVMCGSRNNALQDFRRAHRGHPSIFNILLVDSEEEVSLSPWEHLRLYDKWSPPDLPQHHCQLMVQTVEAWIAADPEAMAGYYGKGFKQSALPARKDIEAVDKERLIEALNRATAGTSKGRYHKIAHCSELLRRIRPDVVRKRAAHCDRLFTTLESLLAQE